MISKNTLAAVVLLMPLTSMAVSAQEQEKEDRFKLFRFLVGSWTGQQKGVPGVGTGARTYEPVMTETYLLGKNRATYPPQEKNPKGEVHEDWEILSYDRARKTFAVRQFNVESFVVHYVLVRSDPAKQVFVFQSEHIENGPVGMQARLTWKSPAADAFEETFEVAMPGENFETYAESNWARQKP